LRGTAQFFNIQKKSLLEVILKKINFNLVGWKSEHAFSLEEPLCILQNYKLGFQFTNGCVLDQCVWWEMVIPIDLLVQNNIDESALHHFFKGKNW